MTASRLTPHQKWALERLRRMSHQTTIVASSPWRWVLGKDVGAPAALEHLVRKGFAEREIRVGPRGGEHRFYRPVQ